MLFFPYPAIDRHAIYISLTSVVHATSAYTPFINWGPRKFLIFGESGGTSRPMPQSGSHCDLVAEREERHTGIEPASSAWEADALPMC